MVEEEVSLKKDETEVVLGELRIQAEVKAHAHTGSSSVFYSK